MMGLSSGLAFGTVAGTLHYASQSMHTHGSIRHLLQSMDLVDAQPGGESDQNLQRGDNGF